MRALVLVFSFLLLHGVIYSQISIVESDPFIIRISTELQGRSFPNECVYRENITVYADGRVIREDCQKTVSANGSSKKTPLRIERKKSSQDVVKLIELIEQTDFLKVGRKYYFESERVAADFVTTITYNNPNIKKQVIIYNYVRGRSPIPKSLYTVINAVSSIDIWGGCVQKPMDESFITGKVLCLKNAPFGNFKN
jgi:hypothetical protein